MKYGKVVGVGNTAVVYEWQEDKVLKLFNSGYPLESIEKEFHNAKAIETMSFGKPKAYEMISYENQTGIVYNKITGDSLLDWVIETQDVKQCAVYMAELHKSILQYKIDDVPKYKDFLKANIKNASSVNSMKCEKKLQLLDRLVDDEILCHGDFHPGNIIMSNGQFVVIDFMNVCRGSYLYDIARTVFLVEYTPVPTDTENREDILYLKKALVLEKV
ncbi:MAG: phosphotransferase [Clostridiales bacterium]|nr:phosphotransferase [Clostridiales bacterium]